MFLEQVPPLSIPDSAKIVFVSTAQEINDAVLNAADSQTILIQDGTYDLINFVPLNIMAHHVTVMGASRDPEKVILLGNGFMRIGGGASGVLVGLYLSDLANQGHSITVGLVATLGAVFFAAELLGALPMGMLVVFAE